MNEQTPNSAARFCLDVAQINFSVTTTLENRAFGQNAVSLQIFPAALNALSLLTHYTAVYNSSCKELQFFFRALIILNVVYVFLIHLPFRCWSLSISDRKGLGLFLQSLFADKPGLNSLNSQVLSVVPPGQLLPSDPPDSCRMVPYVGPVVSLQSLCTSGSLGSLHPTCL